MNKWWMSVFLVASVLLSSCGNNNNNQPLVQNPAPAPYVPQGPSVNCGGGYPQGTPLSNASPMFTAYLSGQNYQGYNGNSISLNLFYTSNYSADVYQQNIVGNGSLYLPDLQYYLGTTQNSPISICTTSPGIYSGQLINVFMQGIVQMPQQQYPYYPNPYAGYGGGYGYGYGYGAPYPYPQAPTSTLLQVTIGQSCQAYVQSGRIIGCVDVSLGQYGSSLRYYAQ